MSITHMLVRVSVPSMLQRFHGCEPAYIRDVCHARCCDAPGRPTGTLVTIHPNEEAAISARGGVVTNGLLESPERVCPFKTTDCLCSLHDTQDKPFGCIASPFTLNQNDLLVVRNRYRLLPCYSTTAERSWGKDPDVMWPHAFEAFRASLDRIFGTDEAGALVDTLRLALCDGHHELPRVIGADMPIESYRMLKENDQIKKDHG